MRVRMLADRHINAATDQVTIWWNGVCPWNFCNLIFNSVGQLFSFPPEKESKNVVRSYHIFTNLQLYLILHSVTCFIIWYLMVLEVCIYEVICITLWQASMLHKTGDPWRVLLGNFIQMCWIVWCLSKSTVSLIKSEEALERSVKDHFK